MSARTVFRTSFGFPAILVMLALTAPAPVAAQFTGCPWCTTPSTCGLVQENTNYDGCLVTQGLGCQPILGECSVIDPGSGDFADAGGLFDQHNIKYLGTNVVSILGIDLEAHQVEENLWVKWGCNGGVIAAFSRSEGGVWREVDSTLPRARYSLDLTLIS